MNYVKISLLIFFSLAIARFIPHPPNFTSLIALSFYVPAIFGISFFSYTIISTLFFSLLIGFIYMITLKGKKTIY